MKYRPDPRCTWIWSFYRYLLHNQYLMTSHFQEKLSLTAFLPLNRYVYFERNSFPETFGENLYLLILSKISNGLNWLWEQHQYEGAENTSYWQPSHLTPPPPPSQKCSIAVTGSSVQRYYLIVLEREHYCCWSIEFLNFLHKSSSSRSNLLLPFVHQNFPTPIYLTPFCPTIELLRIRIIGLNSFILETDYSPSSFLERS